MAPSAFRRKVNYKMEFYDEELLEAKREQERKKHTSLETGIYAGEELIEFNYITLPDSTIRVPLPKCFVIMPDVIKETKYPSKHAPDFIMNSLDTMVTFAFNLLKVINGDVKAMSSQFQTALQNVNPSVIIKKQVDTKTGQGNEMSWFEYNGFQLDGQSYNRVCLIKINNFVLHSIFTCQLKDKEKWKTIVEEIFMAIQEGI